jgi:hypothetical protein
MNFVGAGVTASVSTGTATVTITGGAGSFGVTQTEVDLGSTPKKDGSFTISNGAITNGQRMIITQAGDALTGKGAGDENAMDQLGLAPATCTAGACVVYWSSSTYVKGNFKFNWSVA